MDPSLPEMDSDEEKDDKKHPSVQLKATESPQQYSRHDPHGLFADGRPEGVTEDTFQQALAYLMEDDELKKEGFEDDDDIEALINLLLQLEQENKSLRAQVMLGLDPKQQSQQDHDRYGL